MPLFLSWFMKSCRHGCFHAHDSLIGFQHLFTNMIFKNLLNRDEFAWWLVENTSCSIVGPIGFIELNILAQLIVHSPTIMVGMSSGGPATYICCMVSTIDFFSFSSTS
jgi:hypothetical protein